MSRGRWGKYQIFLTFNNCQELYTFMNTIAGAVVLCPPPWRLLGDPCQGAGLPSLGVSCGLWCPPAGCAAVLCPWRCPWACAAPAVLLGMLCRSAAVVHPAALRGRRGGVDPPMLPVAPGGSWARAGAVPWPHALPWSLCGVYIVGIRRSAFRRVHVPCVASDLLDFQRPAGDSAAPAPPGVSPSTTENSKKISEIS